MSNALDIQCKANYTLVKSTLQKETEKNENQDSGAKKRKKDHAK